MQKKLIALAIAGLSGAAFAQSNVTIYGVADVSFENVKSDGSATGTSYVPNKFRVSNNSSYLGFKGSEDLGNGLKALFQFEQSIQADGNTGTTTASATSGLFTGSTLGGARDTFVGLEGAFGSIKAGVNQGENRVIDSTIEFSPGYAGIATGSSLTGSIGGTKTGVSDRIVNSIKYATPSFSGFQATLVYGANEAKTENAAANAANYNNNVWNLGLSYSNGPIYAGYGHYEAKDYIATAGNAATLVGTATTAGQFNDKLTSDRFGAKYTFPTATSISALYDRTKYEVDPTNGTADQSVKRNAWQLGVAQAFGAHTIYGEYVKAGQLSGNTAAANDTAAKQYIVGYLYNFSKRTTLKAYYTEIKNNANAKYNFYNNGVNVGTTATANNDPEGFGVGIRHSF